jgi:hypothetical protein
MVFLEPSLKNAVSYATYPAMRRRLMLALASLADLEYQQRVWIAAILETGEMTDSLLDVVHELYDDLSIFPNPAESMGLVLVSREEVVRLEVLNHFLTPVITAYDVSDPSRVLQDQRWRAVTAASGSALNCIVRWDGLPWPESPK